MHKLYTYIVKHDTGLAPNPFWGWCTLAVCTPNHQGCRAEPTDWIAGFLDKAHGHRFLYAMEIQERVHMDAYFRDPRFEQKKPLARGSLEQRCGDNFYSLDERGRWIQHETLLHAEPVYLEKDTRHPWVYVSQHFWYLGRDAAELPQRFRALAGGRGVRVNHPAILVEQFKAWVEESFPEGTAALPRDSALLHMSPHRVCSRHGDSRPASLPTVKRGRTAWTTSRG
jgi:hypothetical protein